MVVTIKKNDTKKEIEAALNLLTPKKKKAGLSEFYGKMKGKFGDGLTWQKEIRNEWN